MLAQVIDPRAVARPRRAVVAIRGAEPSLAQEFAELEQNESVEKELAALKARKGKAPSKKSES